MTAAQRVKLMAEWWPAACKGQGWDPKDRNRRLQVLSAAVGRILSSASDLNNTNDIDKVNRRLAHLANPDDLQASIADVNAGDDGERRRLLHFFDGVNAGRLEILCRGMFRTWPVTELQTWQMRSLRKRVKEDKSMFQAARETREIGRVRPPGAPQDEDRTAQRSVPTSVENPF